jgi:hypothetical protein
VDEPCGGNLRVSEHWILTNVFATQSDILTSISSIPAFAGTSSYNGTLPYRYINISHSFGRLLSPVNFRRRTARPVSYYALFKGLLLLSKPPGCYSLSTTFITEQSFRGLSWWSGLFPSWQRSLSLVVLLVDCTRSIQSLPRFGTELPARTETVLYPYAETSTAAPKYISGRTS